MVAPLQRWLPDVGEFARTQLLTAIYRTRPPLRRAASSRPDVRFWERNGSGRPLAGALKKRPTCPPKKGLTCADEHKQAKRSPVCLADTEASTGSIPVLPTRVC
jgi:hypothetical protein